MGAPALLASAAPSASGAMGIDSPATGGIFGDRARHGRRRRHPVPRQGERVCEVSAAAVPALAWIDSLPSIDGEVELDFFFLSLAMRVKADSFFFRLCSCSVCSDLFNLIG